MALTISMNGGGGITASGEFLEQVREPQAVAADAYDVAWDALELLRSYSLVSSIFF